MYPQPYKQCPGCQHSADLAVQQCPACGHMFPAQLTPAEPPRIVGPPPYCPPPYYPPQYPPPYYPPQYPAPMPYAQPKSRVSAALLAFFLGGLGVHAFYLGNNAMGATILIVNLVSIPLMFVGIGFLGLFAMHMIVLIQFTLYLCASDYDFYQKYVIEQRWF